MSGIGIDPAAVQQVITASEDTVSVITQSIKAVEDHMSVLQSALQGTPMQIPARLENWKTVLTSINSDLAAMQDQLRTLYQQMQELLRIAGA